VLVLDAAAAVDLLLRNRAGVEVRRRIAEHALWSVAHLDAEVFSALSRLHRDGQLTTDQVAERLGLLASLDVVRAPITGELLTAAWRLRANVAARDALYVAAAAALGCHLLTTDRRLVRAVPGVVLTVDA
jgi:predicted nucleic acid-binding protein